MAKEKLPWMLPLGNFHMVLYRPGEPERPPWGTWGIYNIYDIKTPNEVPPLILSDIKPSTSAQLRKIADTIDLIMREAIPEASE